jgi:manganese-dependent inorganic pyrophosphatase
MPTAIVTTYRNPDLDGVASAIVWAALLARNDDLDAIPVFFGTLDSETRLVLDALRFQQPLELLSTCPVVEQIYVVDTHDASQLDPSVSTEKVIAILDHHQSGDQSDFPNATLDNQPVGAVATLLAETVESRITPLEPAFLQLLNTAIISNTLNFAAPSTTERDTNAHSWLSAKAPLPNTLAEQMSMQRSVLHPNTSALLERNLKLYTISGHRIGIVQVEGSHTQTLLSRSELPFALEALRGQFSVHHIFLSVVDTATNITFLYAADQQIKILLEQRLDLHFMGNVASSPRILLRKTDLVPLLITSLEERPRILD